MDLKKGINSHLKKGIPKSKSFFSNDLDINY